MLLLIIIIIITLLLKKEEKSKRAKSAENKFKVLFFCNQESLLTRRRGDSGTKKRSIFCFLPSAKSQQDKQKARRSERKSGAVSGVMKYHSIIM
jgi:hypothetical protein